MTFTVGSSFTRLLEGMGIAMDSVRSNKARAALTILGVAIGVAVVVGMAAMVTGIKNSVTEQIETLGPKTFFVQRYFQGGIQISDGSDELSPWRRNPWLKVEEAEMIRRLPGIQAVTWREGTSAPISYESVKLSSVQVLGFSPTWVLVTGGTVVAGRNFTEVEHAANARVVVVNDKLAETLFPGLDPIGKRIKLAGQTYEVIGRYSEPSSLFGESSSPMAVIPHSTFTKATDYFKGWLQFAVTPKEDVSVADAQDQVIAAMRSSRGLRPGDENNFAVVSQDLIMGTFAKITGGFFAVMLALSSVGLMVGGVGVIAIMMISVTERTREIGVRKALGATRREILFQFLVEAATLTLLGGAVGLALGGLIAYLVNNFSPIPAEIPIWSVVVAIMASVVTGVFFGLYPASKASRLDPVEALRYE